MCNAWNHPPDCTCGWGGEGHLGGWSDKIYGNVLSSSQFDTRDSFAHPNAQCPVCGKAVFFYQNIHGSKVYFDHLGQPWPKHPCTNNDNEFKGESFCYSAASGYTFELNSHNAKGWTPIARASISEIRHGVLKLEAIDGAKIHIINAEKVKNGNKYVLRDIIPKYMIAPDFIFYRNPLPSAGNAIYEVDFYSVEVGSHLECGVESLKISLACVADIRKGVFGKPVVSPSFDVDAISKRLNASFLQKKINKEATPEASKNKHRKSFDRKVNAILKLSNGDLARYIKKIEDKNGLLYRIAMNELVRRHDESGKQ